MLDCAQCVSFIVWVSNDEGSGVEVGRVELTLVMNVEEVEDGPILVDCQLQKIAHYKKWWDRGHQIHGFIHFQHLWEK